MPLDYAQAVRNAFDELNWQQLEVLARLTRIELSINPRIARISANTRGAVLPSFVKIRGDSRIK